MSTRVKKKPKLDFQSMLGDPDKQEPRTLREIANEVGFPFTARAVRGAPDATGAVPGEYRGEDARIIKDVSNLCPDSYMSSAHPYMNYDTGARVVGFHCDNPRWVLLGHK